MAWEIRKIEMYVDSWKTKDKEEASWVAKVEAQAFWEPYKAFLSSLKWDSSVSREPLSDADSNPSSD